jgi:hypothetical protein
MTMKHSKELEVLFRRLDGIRMSERERIRAKAHLERAEAVAALIAGVVKSLERLFRKLVVRPLRRLAASG